MIKVEFIGGSCYIKTNSVHNAMFARSCMMSRAQVSYSQDRLENLTDDAFRKYKGSKIDWDFDECDQPFVRMTQPKPRQQMPTNSNSNGGTMANRFDLLNIDDDGDGNGLPSPGFAAAKKTMLTA